MKRLVESSSTDRLSVRAQQLVRAMGRTPESLERQLRVRRSLDRAELDSPRWAWRLAFAFALVGVSAAAAAGGVAILGARSGRPETERAAPATRPALRVRPIEVGTKSTPPVIAAAPSISRTEASASALTPAPRGTAAPRPLPSTPPSDIARVHEAAKALRHEGDPERALQLLERPGARITGPLAEEALALRIEASLSKGDGRHGKLATDYLTQYPNGRYRELARKAIAGPKP